VKPKTVYDYTLRIPHSLKKITSNYILLNLSPRLTIHSRHSATKEAHTVHSTFVIQFLCIASGVRTLRWTSFHETCEWPPNLPYLNKVDGDSIWRMTQYRV